MANNDDATTGGPDIWTGSGAAFARPTGRDLVARGQVFADWVGQRREAGLWTYQRTLAGAPGRDAALVSDTGDVVAGVNFASQDYLSLAAHPRIRDAARAALDTYGPHSAGSPMLVGNTRLSRTLEAMLCDWLRGGTATLYPTGWSAGFGAITGLVRPDDHVCLDARAHACLQTGAMSATHNIRRHRHLDVGHLTRHLQEIRSSDTRNGILVVTEGLFSMDADTPSLTDIAAACRTYGATLLVDVAHDLGSMGPDGTGALGEQGLVGEADVVVGAFSKTFASNGGFVLTREACSHAFLATFSSSHLFSNALSPIQAAVVAEAIRIVRSPEGEVRRRRVLQTAEFLRAELAAHGFSCFGRTSPIVPVLAGGEREARTAARQLNARGIWVNSAEYPAVPIGESRFRLQVMAEHTEEDCRVVAAAIAEALMAARATEDAGAAAA